MRFALLTQEVSLEEDGMMCLLSARKVLGSLPRLCSLRDVFWGVCLYALTLVLCLAVLSPSWYVTLSESGASL